MSHCRVISTWFYDEGGESYGAEIEQNYPGLNLRDLVDVSNVPPSPNIGVWQSIAGGGLVSQIIADPEYGEGIVLTTHDTEATVPTDEKLAAISAKLQELGMSQAEVVAVIGTEAGTRTHWDISQALIGWLRQR